MILHHVISDQVWQNLLPILTLKPQCVVQYRSKGRSDDHRWREHAHNLEEAVKLVGVTGVEFVNREAESDFPTIREWEKLFENGHKDRPASYFNLTGGTKLTAIAAYKFCHGHDIPSFYYDTRRPLISGETGSLPSWPDFRGEAGKITVKAALLAHGYDITKFEPEEVTDGLRHFGREATRLLKEDVVSLRKWLEAVEKGWKSDQGRHRQHSWREILNRPLPSPETEKAKELADLAVEVGILHTDRMGKLFWMDPERGFVGGDNERRELEKRMKMLQGSWWELYVVDSMLKDRRFSDVCWEATFAADSSLGETDVVAFDVESLCLEIVSCKSGKRLEKPLEHLESLRKRAEAMGGPRARATLALFSPEEIDRGGEIQKHAKNHKVGIKGICNYL